MSVSALNNPAFNDIPKENSPPVQKQKIAKVVRVRARYLFEVQTPDKSILLMLIPIRFRQVVYVRVGDIVIVQHVQENNKVKVEMVKLLTMEEMWMYKMKNKWPKEFNACFSCVCICSNRRSIVNKSNDVECSSDSDDDSDSESDSDSSELTDTCSSGSDYDSDLEDDSDD